MLKIREMLESDVMDVARIEQENFSMPWSEQDFRDMLYAPDKKYLVADYNGRVIGGAGIHNILGEAEITNVSILKEFRNRGYAKELLDALLKQGIKMGACSFTLEVRESNAAAIALYRSRGFVTEVVRKNFYEKPRENALIMWKR